jgi:hypothetical protein
MDARRRLSVSAGRVSGQKPQTREDRALRYLDEVLAPYAQVWDQAMLSATLRFLREELGIRRIWYHGWESGNALKGIEPDSAPPRSLYTRLPRQFCFSETSTFPRMLQRRQCKRRLAKAGVSARFHRLCL